MTNVIKKQYNFNLITCYPNSDADCFSYYDGPKIFFEQDESGQLWFLYYANDNMFMCFPVESREDLRPMLDSQIPIREALMAKSEAFLIAWTAHNGFLSQPIDWSDPNFTKYLPDPDVFMSKNKEDISEKSKAVLQESIDNFRNGMVSHESFDLQAHPELLSDEKDLSEE